MNTEVTTINRMITSIFDLLKRLNNNIIFTGPTDTTTTGPTDTTTTGSPSEDKVKFLLNLINEYIKKLKNIEDNFNDLRNNDKTNQAALSTASRELNANINAITELIGQQYKEIGIFNISTPEKIVLVTYNQLQQFFNQPSEKEIEDDSGNKFSENFKQPYVSSNYDGESGIYAYIEQNKVSIYDAMKKAKVLIGGYKKTKKNKKPKKTKKTKKNKKTKRKQPAKRRKTKASRSKKA
jgi:hypothetical protein